MTGWKWIDAIVEVIRRQEVPFFLLALALYWITCLWGL